MLASPGACGVHFTSCPPSGTPTGETFGWIADSWAPMSAIDPKVSPVDVPEGVQLVECTPEVLADADIVVILTDHDDIDWDLVARHSDRVLDTRNKLSGSGVDRL